MKKILSVLIAAILIINISGCNSSKKNPSNQTIYYNLESDPESLDPQIANDDVSNLVIANIFEGLIKIDKDNNIMPAVSESYEANSNYTSFTFNLRKDAKWSDKDATPVTASDFVFALRRAVMPRTKSPTAFNLFSIKNAQSINNGSLDETSLGVYALDDYKIKIDLEYSYEDFPRLMALPVAMPCNENLFNSTNGQYGLRSDCIPSNGPFMVKAKYGWERENNLTLLKNENYCGNFEAIPIGVKFSIGTLSGSFIDKVNDGKIDAGHLPSNEIDTAEKEKYNITSFDDTIWGLCFNFNDSVFKNLNMRKAFIQSLNRDYVLSSLQSGSVVANDIVMNSINFEGENYRNLAGSNLYLPEVTNAKSFLISGMKELGLSTLSDITVLCTDDSEVKSMVSNMIEIWNRELGYYFNMKPVSNSELNDNIQAGQYQLAIAPMQTTDDNVLDILYKFTSTSSDNICNMKDSKYDSLIKNATDSNSSKRLDYCIQGEKYLNSQGAFYPLYCGKRFYASAPNVTGIVFYQYGGIVDFTKSVKARK